MPATIRMGINGKLYYGAAGSTAATEVTNCRDLSYSVEPTRGDTSKRASPFKLSQIAMMALSVEWEMVLDTGDATLTALRAAAVAGTPVALRTRDHAAGYGVDCDWNLSMSKGEPLEGSQTVKFTAEPDSSEGRVPVWA